MKRLLIPVIIAVFFSFKARGQEAFFIKDFDILVQVQKDASLKVTEKITVEYTSPRHGIFRKIPYRYRLRDLPDTVQHADLSTAWISKGYRYTKLKNIKVRGFESETYKEGDYETIKIGSKDKWVNGEQVYEISYTLLGAVNFFDNHSEIYLNLTGNAWPVKIMNARFRIELYQPLKNPGDWFVATGLTGSTENVTDSRWVDNKTLEGTTTEVLAPYEGITAGISLPAGFLTKPNYKMMGKGWLVLPVLSFFIMFWVWRKWGKNLPITVTTQFYPPDNVNPSVAGYVIDGKLDKRDLTALIPYWGAGGYLKVEETQKKSFMGLITDSEFTFTKLKDLPATAETFEQTMFNGLFYSGDVVQLSDLKNSFYSTMNAAKRDLEHKIDKSKYYVKYTRGFSAVLPIAGLVILALAVINLFSNYPLDVMLWASIAVASLPVIIFGALMEKKTQKGTELYQDLLGFKEFIKSVEKDRLREFLSQDANYFDKVLPFAIVFDVADTWKDKLKGLDIPPPSWYSGYYAGNTFNTMGFMNSLDRGMNSMSRSFYSTPSSTGSSGGSFSGGGGGGFSGGGFGGGGGGSW